MPEALHRPTSRAAFADRVRGCLLGGAVGDALGAQVEFASWTEIERRYGPHGVRDLAPPGRFTDDTQMTLFTCEGLIRASVRWRERGICHPPTVVRHAYLRWLHTQGLRWRDAARDFASGDAPDGWLAGEPRLHRRQAPGNTCLSALSIGGHGTRDEPINDSKGCGGVMRAAPVGLFMRTSRAEEVYELGCDTAALTHGHPDGWHPAGAVAVVVAELTSGTSLTDAVERAMAVTSPHMRDVLTTARDVAAAGMPDPRTIEETFGGGWVGDEALAIAVCCALAATDFADGVAAAANHSGDSDSTAAICGNILGARDGPGAIPGKWLEALDARDIVETIADDVVRELVDTPTLDDGSVPQEWWERYPGW